MFTAASRFQTGIKPFKGLVQGSETTYGTRLNGSSQYIATDLHGDFNVNASQNWMVEVWIYATATVNNSSRHIVFNDGSKCIGLISSSTTGYALNQFGSGNLFATPAGVQKLNQWQHFRIVRVGATMYLFLDGIMTASASNLTNFTGTNYSISFGGNAAPNAGTALTGTLSNAHIMMNNAPDPSVNFIPPRGPIQAQTGTVFLGLQSATMVDASSRNTPITAAGSPTVISINSSYAG